MIGERSPCRCTTSTCCKRSFEAGLGLGKDDADDEATKRQTRSSSDAFAMVFINLICCGSSAKNPTDQRQLAENPVVIPKLRESSISLLMASNKAISCNK